MTASVLVGCSSLRERNPSSKATALTAKTYRDGPDDLFDLVSYSLERENLAGDPTYIDVERDLGAHLEEWFAKHEDAEKSGLRVKDLPRDNSASEAWREGIRETRKSG